MRASFGNAGTRIFLFNNNGNNGMKICLLGGTGFVGRELAARLVAAGHYVRIVTRHRERHRDLLVLPTAHVEQGDPMNAALLKQQFRGMDAVVNLVGILNPTRRESFERVHVELPRRVVKACEEAGVARLIHMSALGATADAPSAYLRSKAAGEAAVRNARLALAPTIVRPSVIFGPGDRFTRRFARLLARIPGVFPLAAAGARLQPVYIDDVVSVFTYTLRHRHTAGRDYSLCGPTVFSLQEIVGLIAKNIGVVRRIVPLGTRTAYWQAALMERLPGQLLTRDNLASLSRDNVCTDRFPAEFGISPTPIEAVLPAYLSR